jgi:hypothetical protein
MSVEQDLGQAVLAYIEVSFSVFTCKHLINNPFKIWIGHLQTSNRIRHGCTNLLQMIVSYVSGIMLLPNVTCVLHLPSSASEGLVQPCAFCCTSRVAHCIGVTSSTFQSQHTNFIQGWLWPSLTADIHRYAFHNISVVQCMLGDIV